MDSNIQADSQTINSPRQNACLKDAIERNDRVLLKSIIEQDANINAQDNEGNTGLHHAIRVDADIEIIRELLIAGASATIENNAGDIPIRCVQPESIGTMMNLLKLEKSIPLQDQTKINVIWTLVDGIIAEGAIDLFWETISKELSVSDISANAINDVGETLLHIAARQTTVAMEKHLTFILSMFDNLDVFQKNAEGRTFFHVIFEKENTNSNGNYTNFISCLLNGCFPYCSKSAVKVLLNCQDNYKLTPLHIVLRDPFNVITPDVLQLFFEAGSDFHGISRYNDTLLHCVIRNEDNEIMDTRPENEVENIDYLIGKGLDVNAVDIFGGSPVFYSLLPDIITQLIKHGAQIDLKNKFGQTALVFHTCLIAFRDWDVDPYNIEIFKTFLDNGANINARDNCGSNILHYAAWEGLPLDVIQLLKQRGAEVCRDDLGQLPCDVAYQRRNRDTLAILCNCDNASHHDKEMFVYQNESVEDTELYENQWDGIECISKYRRYIEDKNFLSKLLRLPGVGRVTFSDEADDLRLAVTNLVHDICKEISKSDDLLSCSLFQSGSVGENTKIGLPDEFDFVCILDRISDICSIDEKLCISETGYVSLIIKEECKDRRFEPYFDRQGCLKTNNVWVRFRTLLGKQLVNTSLFYHPNIFFIGDHIKDVTQPTCQFSIMWIGSHYKYLKVDIDLVPACKIKDWWPESANVEALACDWETCKSEGFMLLIQTMMNKAGKPATKFRISAQKAERMHISKLPQLARDAYIVSKILCDKRICPDISATKYATVGTYIKSYMLKNCMFHVFHGRERIQTAAVENTYTADELHHFVLQIFRTLLDCSTEENLPAYLLPWQNIFTFAVNIDKDMEDAHERCAYRSVFAKIILTMLGQLEKLSDCEKDILFEYKSWFQTEDSITEESD